MQAKRLAQLRALMDEHQLEALLITNAFNRRYLTGFLGSSGNVLITHDRAYLLTDFRYMTQAAEQTTSYEILEHQRTDEIGLVRDLLRQLSIRSVGFEQRDVTFGAYQHFAMRLQEISLVPTEGLIEQLRSIKDEAELQIIREATQLADRAYSHILNVLKPGIQERVVALELEYFLRSNGADSSSFDIIVASGERSALPHGRAGDRVLQRGEFVKMDFGAYYKGYCSDITRTVVLGKPTPKHKEIYDIVLHAQQVTLDRLKPGLTGREGDAIARDIIKHAGYGDRFGHGTGHSFGLEIHEEPRLSTTCDKLMEPGMTMTVEPGIYIPGFGGVRIEDDIVFTNTGIEVLSQSSKAFTIID